MLKAQQSTAAQTMVRSEISPVLMVAKLPATVELLLAEVFSPMLGKSLLGMVLVSMTYLFFYFFPL